MVLFYLGVGLIYVVRLPKLQCRMSKRSNLEDQFSVKQTRTTEGKEEDA
jgi:hypothetical protein